MRPYQRQLENEKIINKVVVLDDCSKECYILIEAI